MGSVTLQINGITTSGPEGMTILELARKQGYPIPTLCHDPHLSPAGACRICVVEEENRGVLIPSCVTAIASGMAIRTDSPRVIETRKTILQLLLASHPESCIVCDKGNRCQLRTLAADLGLGFIPLDPMPQYFPVHDFNPFFKRDMSKCILCGKCIRGDQELVVEGVLDYSHRGFPSRPTTFQNLPLEETGCTFCGTCLSLCPTGALSETGLAFQGSLSEKTATVCSHCACGCSLTAETHSGRVIRITPTADPQRDPTLCVKGHFGFHYIHNPERLQNPLIRRDGHLVETSWEEALKFLVERFQTIRQESGSDSIGCLAGPQLTNEEFYLFQKMARLGLKTPHVDNSSRLYAAPAFLAMEKALGLNNTIRPLENLSKSDVILVLGANPTETAPVLGYRIKKAVAMNKARLILVDPRKTKLAHRADIWLRPKPGTDLSLIQCLIHTLLTENLWDQGFVYSQTQGFLEWRESFFKLNWESELSATGLEENPVRETARALAAAKNLAVVLGDGLTQQLNASAAVMALINLILLLGQWGRPGCGLYPVLKESNAQGAWDMGVLPNRLPGYQAADDPRALKNFEAKWGSPIPAGPGLSALEMLDSALSGQIKALYCVSEDPVGSYPDRKWVEAALDGLSFLVVQDLFLTETAQKAHLVLPAASQPEKEGTFTNMERRVHRLRRAVPLRGQAKADGEIFSLILTALENSQGPYKPIEQRIEALNREGVPRETNAPGSTPFPVSDLTEKVFNEIREMVPGYAQITAEGLDRQPLFLTAVDPSPRLYSFESPKIHLDRPEKDPDYPYILITGGMLSHLGVGTRTWKDPRLKAVTPPPAVTLSPEDAAALGIASGDLVRIQSKKGALSLSARVGEECPPGVFFLPIAYPELKINSLFDAFWDPVSKGSLHRPCSVRIVKDQQGAPKND
jgi:formate dehydrogenase alpha subunit